MCGRYRLARKREILAEVSDAGDDSDWGPRYNIAPTQSVPVVRQDATRPVRSLSLVRWGLIPFWAKDAKAGYKMINARAETIAERPAFREPLEARRCLIPADGSGSVVELYVAIIRVVREWRLQRNSAQRGVPSASRPGR